MISRAAVSNELAVLRAAVLAASATFEACFLASPMARSKPWAWVLLFMADYLTYDDVDLIPPMAARRLGMGRVADEKADAERYGRGGVGIVFDELANNVMAFNGGLFHALGTFHGGVHGLAVGVLYRASRLIHHAFQFGRGVAGDFANAFLHLAADIAHCAGNSIIGHEHPPNSGMPINEGVAAKVPHPPLSA